MDPLGPRVQSIFSPSDSPRPSAESDRDKSNRCVVCQGSASDGASIDRALRDANGRRWPVGPAPTLLSTESMTVATTATTDDQRRESADSSERRPTIGAAGQDTQAGGLDASTRLTGRRRPLGGRQASRVEWPVTAPTSTCFCLDEIMASDRWFPVARSVNCNVPNSVDGGKK
jgi:hypothetical protein